MSEQYLDWVEEIEILGHWGERATIADEALVVWAEHLEGAS